MRTLTTARVGDAVRFPDGNECEIVRFEGEWLTIRGKSGLLDLVLSDLIRQDCTLVEGPSKVSLRIVWDGNLDKLASLEGRPGIRFNHVQSVAMNALVTVGRTVRWIGGKPNAHHAKAVHQLTVDGVRYDLMPSGRLISLP